jgi:hypothetical protein
MIKGSVAHLLCRIEDDSSLTPVSEHEDIVAGVAAGRHRVEVEDLDFGYALFADGCRVAISQRDVSVIVSGHVGTGG